MNSIGANIEIRGHVQGVGYRYFCVTRAIRLGLTGWVRNTPQRSVAVYAEGDRGSLEIFIDELKRGPMAAAVAGVDVRWTAFTGKYDSFSVVG